MGHRVMSLHHCLDAFDLFGFGATRDRLRLAASVRGRRWTGEQVEVCVTLLEQARASWLAEQRAEAARRREVKRSGRRTGAVAHRDLHLRWLTSYVDGDASDVWRTAGLGDCSDCGHRWIHHTARGCRLDGALCRRGFPVPDWRAEFG